MESFEEGQLISRYVNSPSNPHNAKLAAIGLGSYLKMLLKDNFIHADLHPGNILVRTPCCDPPCVRTSGLAPAYFGRTQMCAPPTVSSIKRCL